MSTQRIPPYSEEAERGVIGSILIDFHKVLELCDNSGIVTDSFYVPAHRCLFDHLQQMSQDGKAIDLVTVGEHLKSAGELDRIGGYEFLDGIIDDTPTAAHAEYYIGFVRQKHLLRKIIDESTLTIDRCYEGGDDDAESILDHAQSNLFDISSASRLSEQKSLGEIAEEVCERWDGIIEGTITHGIEPFLPELRALLGNFVSGNPYFIGAEPGGGKSVMLQNQAVFTATQGIPVALASLEMTEHKLVSRILGERGDFSSWAMDNREYGDSHFAKSKLDIARRTAKRISKLPLYIEDKPMDVDEFCSWAMRMRVKHGVRLIGCDYFQLLQPPARMKLKGQEATVYVCGKLQQLLKNDDVVKIILSQLTKLPRDPKTGELTRKPKKDDLYGGRPIDAVSEGTILVFGDDETATILVDKNRGGGVGEVKANFVKNRSRFESRVKDEQEDEQGGLI